MPRKAKKEETQEQNPVTIEKENNKVQPEQSVTKEVPIAIEKDDDKELEDRIISKIRTAIGQKQVKLVSDKQRAHLSKLAEQRKGKRIKFVEETVVEIPTPTPKPVEDGQVEEPVLKRTRTIRRKTAPKQTLPPPLLMKEQFYDSPIFGKMVRNEQSPKQYSINTQSQSTSRD
ncbi:hypothetical protein HDV06_002539 [Boothiomyces sp. JEL0866]|nr:hypothetical protein HDV06_002539 [Boothiomyces sp. JEL0866]